MKNNLFKFAGATLLTLAVGVHSNLAGAAVSAAEAATLQGERTPIGAEKAGNEDGSIPAWTGGFSPKQPPTSGRRSNPYASERPLYSINAQSVDKYAQKLSPGVLAMFKKYPQSYRIDVYPTHRTASMPQDYYDATLKSATTTRLVKDDGGYFRVEGDTGGVPFPIPKDGAEVMMNNNVIYAPYVEASASNYLLQSDGRRILVSTYNVDLARYTTNDARIKDGQYLGARAITTNPPIRAGEQIVTHNFVDPNKDSSWVYLPGQRRVRKLPNSCCDTPTPFASGLITFDEISLFFGSMHRFDWKLTGKKEMLVPYNNNDYLVPSKVEDVIGRSHLNPDHIRWELHRVWVVEAKLREGQRHVFNRSTYYVDEDTWAALLADRYDSQGQLAKTGIQLTLLLTETGTAFPLAYSWYDLLSGAAYISNIFNDQSNQLRVLDTLSRAKLSPDAMAGEGIR